MLDYYLEEIKKLIGQKLEITENLEDYFILKNDIEKINDSYKELNKLLDLKLLEIF